MALGSPNRQGLLGRWWAAMMAGMSFGGKRDIYTVYGYPRNLEAGDLFAKYERQDIASRIVDVPPEETWSNPPVLEADAGFLRAWDELQEKFDLWNLIAQADKLLAFGEFSALLLGVPGKIDAPITQITLDNVAYIQAYGGDNAAVEQYERNTNNPRFGQPLYYTLKTDASDPISIRAHYSRIVHLVDRPLMGNLQSVPRLRQVYNILDDILKIGGGSAETFWITANRGMQVDVDKEMELTTEDAKALSDELEEFQHQLRRYIRTRGVTIKNLGSEVADPTGVFKVLIALLASATGIPQRILMGAEAGQLASEQDRANWAEYMERRRKRFAEPYVLRPIIKRFQEIKLLPEAKGIKYVWPEAFHLSPLERAQTMAQSARAIVNLSRQSQLGFPIVSLEEAREIIGLPNQVEGTLPPPYDQIKAEFEQEPDTDDDPPGEGTNARQRQNAIISPTGETLVDLSPKSLAALTPKDQREPVNVTVNPPNVHVDAPTINVSAPKIDIPAPVVNVPAPIVNVQPPKVEVTYAPPVTEKRNRTVTVKRQEDGSLKGEIREE